MHLHEQRARNCQQEKDELVPKIWLLNQCFEVARAINKKNVMIGEMKRQSGEWWSTRTCCSEKFCIFSQLMAHMSTKMLSDESVQTWKYLLFTCLLGCFSKTFIFLSNMTEIFPEMEVILFFNPKPPMDLFTADILRHYV